MPTITFKAYALEEIEAKLDRVLELAAECGIEFPYTFSEVYKVKEVDRLGREFECEYQKLEYEVPTLALGKYSFAASINYESGLPFTRAVPGLVIPPEMMCASGTCTHCGVKRYRKQVYVVRSDTGEFERVGSSCVNKYLGIEVGRSLQAFTSLLGALDEVDGCSNISFPVTYLIDLVMWSIHAIQAYGFVSRRKAEAALYEDHTRLTTTADLVSSWSGGSPDKEQQEKLDRLYREHVCVHESLAREIVAEVRAWPATEPFSYKANVAAAFASDTISSKPWHRIPFITAQVAAALVAREPKASPEEVWADTYLGAPKTRVRGIKVKVMRSSIIGTGVYGPRWCTVLSGPANEQLVWFGTKGLTDYIGKDVLATFTITEHGEYQGQKQTLINRVEIG